MSNINTEVELPKIPFEYELELDHLKLKFYKITYDDLKIKTDEIILKKPDFFNKEKVKEIIDNAEAHVIEFIPIYKDNETGITFEGKIEEIRKDFKEGSKTFEKIKDTSEELEILVSILNNYFYSYGFSNKEYSIDDGYDIYHNKYPFKLNDSKEFKDKQLKLLLNEHLELIKEKIKEIEELKNGL